MLKATRRGGPQTPGEPGHDLTSTLRSSLIAAKNASPVLPRGCFALRVPLTAALGQPRTYAHAHILPRASVRPAGPDRADLRPAPRLVRQHDQARPVHAPAEEGRPPPVAVCPRV